MKKEEKLARDAEHYRLGPCLSVIRCVLEQDTPRWLPAQCQFELLLETLTQWLLF